MTVFQYRDYKGFIRAKVDENEQERGYKTRLAKAAGCQLSFLSQVLHSHVDLTPDHALGMTTFWGLDQDERDYFLELLNLARASTPALRRVITERLSQLKGRSEDLSHRFQRPRLAEGPVETLYYSSWHWSAIHILVTIPGYQTPSAISARLGLPRPLVEESLKRLEEQGLVRAEGGRWIATQHDIHVPRESLLGGMNHANWRHRAILDAQTWGRGSIHYTAVHSLSRSDVEKLKDVLLAAIDQSRDIVKPSREEELVCLCCDLFQV